MTARAELVTALEVPLEPVGIDVQPYAQVGVRPARPLVMVKVDKVSPHPQARLTHRAYAFQLVLLGSLEDTAGPGDDELDQALEDVLEALDEGHAMGTLPQWTEARRAVYGDTIPAYEIDVNAWDVKRPTEPDPAP